MSKPTIYLASWDVPDDYAPGVRVVYTIDHAPPAYRTGDGLVQILIPTIDELAADDRAFRKAYKSRLAMLHLTHGYLAPGRLMAWRYAYSTGEATHPERVEHGATLATACRPDETARNHRLWAARALAWAGWRVVCDDVTIQHKPK